MFPYRWLVMATLCSKSQRGASISPRAAIGRRSIDIPRARSSAVGGKKSQSYLEMLARIKNGEFENLIAWLSDKLHRSHREQEEQ